MLLFIDLEMKSCQFLFWQAFIIIYMYTSKVEAEKPVLAPHGTVVITLKDNRRSTWSSYLDLMVAENLTQGMHEWMILKTSN